MNSDRLILSTAYFPSMQFFTKLLQVQNIEIELFENYQRQTYRNRCNILASCGIMALSVPVVKPLADKILIRDVEIDYSTRWQHNHFHAIKSAYRNSAYYEFYFDDFECFFRTKEKYLIDFNQKIIESLIQAVGFNRNINYTKSFEQTYPNNIDYRFCMSPKLQNNKIDSHFKPIQYHQVFEPDGGFVPNLSVLDLLFNEGPLTYEILRKSIAF